MPCLLSMIITVTCIYVDSIGYPVVTLGYGIKTAASESIRRVSLTPSPTLTCTDQSTHPWQDIVFFAKNKPIGWSTLYFIPLPDVVQRKGQVWGNCPAMLSQQELSLLQFDYQANLVALYRCAPIIQGLRNNSVKIDGCSLE